jgi:hypothetical protein
VTAAAALNLLANAAHGISHWRAAVPLASWQVAFIVMVACLVPAMAATRYWTPDRRAGAVTLAGSMLTALLFDLYYHFIADTPDHVSYRRTDLDGVLFVSTAALLVLAELTDIGVWLWE